MRPAAHIEQPPACRAAHLSHMSYEMVGYRAWDPHMLHVGCVVEAHCHVTRYEGTRQGAYQVLELLSARLCCLL